MVMGSLRQEAEVVVIGSGPGGYVAALRAADLGREVILVEAEERLGGVCLREGCIPSKALINVVELAASARDAARAGLTFDGLRIDPAALRQWTESVVSGLSKGVDQLLARRGVEVVRGHARFDDPKSLLLEDSDVAGIDFRHCIVATGSRARRLPLSQDLPIWTSAEALKVPEVPERLLVVGGGYIGLELGLVYAGLGSKVSVVEFHPRFLIGADTDLVKVVVDNCERRFDSIRVGSQVVAVEKTASGFAVSMEHEGRQVREEYDHILAAVGREPNTDDIGLAAAGLTADERGLIPVSPEGRTAVPHLFAIGDVTAGPALAHKASREAKVAAEVISGLPSSFDNCSIPPWSSPIPSWPGPASPNARPPRPVAPSTSAASPSRPWAGLGPWGARTAWSR